MSWTRLRNRGEVVHERGRSAEVAGADVVRRNELRVRVERNPRPHVPGLVALLRRDVPLLAANERPNLVALNPLAGQIVHHAIHVDRADRAQVDQEF